LVKAILASLGEALFQTFSEMGYGLLRTAWGGRQPLYSAGQIK
jgi:hypothetical protein